jgi:hypothetical protein
LETSNIALLKSEGIKNAHKIVHASEFKPIETSDYKYQVSFVGHLMAGLKDYPTESLAYPHHLLSLAWARLSSSEAPMQPRLAALSEQIWKQQAAQDGSVSANAIQQSLVANLNKLSSAYRGELLSKIEKTDVTIVGGDLSYGSIDHPLMKLDRPNVKYIPATHDYSQTATIYNQSRVNINISSLQFDTAVNNRIIDIILSGGMVLTDKRAELCNLTSRSTDITFDSPEELSNKIEIASRCPTSKTTIELKKDLLTDAKANHTYEKVVTKALDHL